MSQEHLEFKTRHAQFVQSVCESKTVYALKNSEGYATSFSNELVDEADEPVEVFCFWSSQEMARTLQQDEWKDFEIDAIDLAAFLENWCVGMSNEGLLIGTNFDMDLNGFESDPLELILEITQELQAGNQSLNLIKFKNINDLENQVKEVLEN